MQPPPTPAPSSSGFSLVELLVSMTILTAIMLMFVGILDQTQKTWDFAQGQISQYREARVAFDLMTKNITQATLNTYYEQFDENGDGVPEDYVPKSELHFITLRADKLSIPSYEQIGPGQAIFFQAPLGTTDWTGGPNDPRITTSSGGSRNLDLSPLSNLLTARGYYVAYNGDKDYRPAFLTSSLGLPERKRYRLMEFIPPTEANKIYFDYAEVELKDPSKPPPPGTKYFDRWYRDPRDLVTYSRPLAENIIALCISPREPLADRFSGSGNPAPQVIDREMSRHIAPNFEFNSEDPDPADPKKHPRHILPPLVKITMIALDETSAIRLESRFNERPYMKFGTVGTERGLVPKATWLASAENLAQDLDDFNRLLEEQATASSGVKVRYKIFSSTINIKGSKWQSR